MLLVNFLDPGLGVDLQIEVRGIVVVVSDADGFEVVVDGRSAQAVNDAVGALAPSGQLAGVRLPAGSFAPLSDFLVIGLNEILAGHQVNLTAIVNQGHELASQVAHAEMVVAEANIEVAHTYRKVSPT